MKRKNFRKLPQKIKAKLQNIASDYIEVGVTVRCTHEQLKKGFFKNLDVLIDENENVLLPESIQPSVRNGRTSKVNFLGKENIRKDLPKVSRTYSMEVPSWGNKGNTHTVYIDRLVYERDYIPPSLYKIKIELLRKEHGDELAYIIKFILDTPLLKSDIDFSKDLLFMINLLQENVGFSDIFQSNASDEEYLATQYLDWEIFPPGERDLVVSKFIQGKRKANSTLHARLEERYHFLMRFKPESFIRGANGFKSYFGAKLPGDVVVFENIDYGNAVYVIKENWEKLSKLSRIELMQKYRGQFERVIHGKEWKSKLTDVIDRLQIESIE